jgi:pyruvate dehydrogenase (quinone)
MPRHDGPALVEILVSRQEISMPTAVGLDRAKSFSLFMLRAVLSGRCDEIIDLAKVSSSAGVRSRLSMSRK